MAVTLTGSVAVVNIRWQRLDASGGRRPPLAP